MWMYACVLAPIVATVVGDDDEVKEKEGRSLYSGKRASCSTHECGYNASLKEDYEDRMCEGATCGDTECCDPRLEAYDFDCDAGFEIWRLGWSLIKQKWCCAAHSKGCEDATHVVGQTGGNGCIVHLTKDDCEVLAASYRVGFERSVSWSTYPKGCFRKSDGKLCFNEHATGSGNTDAKPICREMETAPPTPDLPATPAPTTVVPIDGPGLPPALPTPKPTGTPASTEAGPTPAPTEEHEHETPETPAPPTPPPTATPAPASGPETKETPAPPRPTPIGTPAPTMTTSKEEASHGTAEEYITEHAAGAEGLATLRASLLLILMAAGASIVGLSSL
jgi:hypothetical protein